MSSRSKLSITVIAGAMAIALLIASCGFGDDGDGALDPKKVRSCVTKGEQKLRGDFLFLVKKEDKPGSFGENEDQILVLVDQPLGAKSGTISVVVSDSDEFLDQLEERDKKAPNATVTRADGAVVTYEGDFEGTYARAKRLVDSCVKSDKG